MCCVYAVVNHEINNATKNFRFPLTRSESSETDPRHSYAEFDKNSRLDVVRHRSSPEISTRGWKKVERRVSFFAALSAGWPGVVICWSPRCRRPEVGPWLFVQRRWLPTRAIWNDVGPPLKNEPLPIRFLLLSGE